MPTWITAIGIACTGVVYGYLLLFTLKRYLPPVSDAVPSLKDLIPYIASMGLVGGVGMTFGSIDNVNYMGPYGIGLLLGLGANVVITLRAEQAESGHHP